MKLVIVGGVAGGASAAARARRLDETAGIVMFERGEFISFANCGLPYHVGNVIKERSSLLVMTPERFRARTAIDVRTRHEVTAINRARHTVTVRNLENGQDSEEAYDKLILVTGSSPVKPPIPGADDPDVMQLWTIPDMDRIKGRVDEGAKRALVVGGGFIGLEVAENLRERGLDVTLVEMLPSLLPTLDPEMARPLADGLRQHGVTVRLGRKVTRIRRPESETRVASRLTVSLDDGAELPADFVVLAVGVKPNSGLARQASLEIGERGGIRVNEFLQTSDADIYAVGDVNEVTDRVRRQPAQIPLAGPANRQGRVAADNALGARRVYRGTLGTNVVKVFELTAGSAGPGERRLREDGTAFHKVYLHPQSHAGYYPGAAMMSLKLLFAPDGKVLGVQAVGRDGVDKRIDVVATAIQAGMTVEDLADLELAYSPPYGSAKDPVNFAGMIAANVLRGDSRPVYAEELAPGDFLLDVREPEETLRAASEAVMREVIGDRTVDEVITIGRQDIEVETKAVLQRVVEQYQLGMSVDLVQLKNVNPPKPVQASFDEVNQAQQEKQRAINMANGEYNKVVPRAKGDAERLIAEAHGYAQKRVNEAEGDAASFNAVFAQYQKAPEVTRQRLFLETMTEVLPKTGRKIIVDDKGQQVLPLLQLQPEK